MYCHHVLISYTVFMYCSYTIFIYCFPVILFILLFSFMYCTCSDTFRVIDTLLLVLVYLSYYHHIAVLCFSYHVMYFYPHAHILVITLICIRSHICSFILRFSFFSIIHIFLYFYHACIYSFLYSSMPIIRVHVLIPGNSLYLVNLYLHVLY